MRVKTHFDPNPQKWSGQSGRVNSSPGQSGRVKSGPGQSGRVKSGPGQSSRVKLVGSKRSGQTSRVKASTQEPPEPVST